MFKISEVSQKLQIPVPTIRYYTDLDLIPNLKRNSEGQRIFDDEDLVWLKGIKFFRELGMPLPEIKAYIKLCQKHGPVSVKKRYAVLLEQQQRAQESLNESKLHLDQIEHRLKLTEQIMNGKKRDSLSAARRFCQW